jgi:hypothetical protein
LNDIFVKKNYGIGQWTFFLFEAGDGLMDRLVKRLGRKIDWERKCFISKC